MTSTEATQREYVNGQTYPMDEVFRERSQRCDTLDSGYVCTLPAGHRGPQHVGAVSSGLVVHVWARDTSGDPDTEFEDGELGRFRAQVRSLAHAICTARGYGNFEVWNDTMVRLGLPPFTERKLRLVAPAAQALYAFPDGWTEERAQEWMDARSGSIAEYMTLDLTTVGEPRLVIDEQVPRYDEDVEADPRASTDDLDEYKALVREVAIEMAEDQSWCDNGLNGVLGELGLDPKTRDWDVTIVVTARQTLTLTREASTADSAASMVDRYDVNEYVDSSDWEITDWEVDEVNEA